MPEKSRPAILVVGSLNVDLVTRTNRVPLAGETLTGNSFARFSGGKGANQAVAASRMGAHTYMLGRVGTDLFGDDQLRSLAASGVDITTVIQDSSASTGVAVIVVEEDTGQNRIIIVPGANGNCTAADIWSQRQLVGNVSCVVAQLEVPLPAIEAAAELAYEIGALFVLDPAPARPLPTTLLARVGLLTPNETEAESLTGIRVHDTEGAREAAEVLRAQGVRSVIITLGARGVYGMDDTGDFHLLAHKVQAVDTVAAGDAFTGALAVALAEGSTLREAATLANAVAAITVTRHGAQAAMPLRAEVDAMLRQP